VSYGGQRRLDLLYSTHEQSQDRREYRSARNPRPSDQICDILAAMRLIDRITRSAVGLGIGRRSTALLETIGRKSGEARVTPVTNGLDGDVFWLVTEHGHRANYVRNIEAQPRVRVNAGRGWRPGTAQIVDDNPDERLQKIEALNRHARTNARIVRRTGTEHLVIRIDLDADR